MAAGANPGTGLIAFNNASVASTTAIYLNATDSNGNAQSTMLTAFGSSTNATKGFLIVRDATVASKFAMFSCAAVTNNTGWYTFTVTSLSYSTTAPFTTSESLVFAFLPFGNAGTNGAAGAPVAYSVITADPAPAAQNVGYACNTSSAAFTVTLPASPTTGQPVMFADYAGTFNTNNLTISGNGNNIVGSSTTLTVDIKNASFGLLYVGGTTGWTII